MDREDEAWAAVAARWQDEEAHRAYLAAHNADLGGLAEAGRRYRAILESDPSDAVALRWRDEVVRRATAIALAQLPRTTPAPERRGLRRALVVALIVGFMVAIAYALMRMGSLQQAATP
jgi:hypothetical protein